MGKQKDWSIIACAAIYVFLASQIHCTSQTHFRNRIEESKRENDSSDDTDHSNLFPRIDRPLLHKTISRLSLQKPVSGHGQERLKRKNLIKELFGQPPVDFKQYGGYVTINKKAGRFLYYYFVESAKANKSAPLVLWFNGGPSCSSLLGAFSAHGPFRVHSDGKTLYRNPYSWNNEANMLYIESPTEVGFSYTNTPSKKSNSKGDTITAEENYAFLLKWLDRFPEYKTREVFIAAESYGGHFGPQLAQMILQRNNQTFINLKGVLIGNPSIDDESRTKGNEDYLVSHALATREILTQRNQICLGRGEMDENCSNAIERVSNLTDHLDVYNIYAPVCLNSNLTSKPNKHTTVTEFDPCSLEYMTAYLNMAEAQKAMHANTTKLNYPWKQCNLIMELYWVQEEQSQSMLPLLDELMKKGLRILVFSGDTDSVVSVTASLYALKKMNLTVVNPWRPWFSEGQVGGFIEEYKEKLTFATVRGAGHSVASDEPIRALTLFTNFIGNTSLPLL